jgi:hypothetical protein
LDIPLVGAAFRLAGFFLITFFTGLLTFFTGFIARVGFLADFFAATGVDFFFVTGFFFVTFDVFLAMHAPGKV